MKAGTKKLSFGMLGSAILNTNRNLIVTEDVIRFQWILNIVSGKYLFCCNEIKKKN
jgi:hypothetical protein